MSDGNRQPAPASTVRAELVSSEGRITLTGEIDHGVAPELDAALERLLSSGAERLVVDFAKLSFFDSACISALVRAHATVSERGGTVTIVNVDRFAHRVLQIAGLLPLFEIVPAEEQGEN
ncbi:SpoIIAA-like anti-anti-sigma regulatory factor [Prauserella shujinwangii]|uniref:Anti-sigma factor antagonist n=1 Tax=Prauserella shujinwangii TaxID=1453103 RepID=A0A2T0M020_9PSEU|nr:STAS domain-containing protein [Prauserella shujinwangii]PRX49928.1 SpoIIAA-like anti-anti-sigma regulatory factor [Prauserella shujinwangii]